MNSPQQCEAISYGPLRDLHLSGLCMFMSMQIPRLMEFSGGGKWNVVNPVPANPRYQMHALKSEGGVFFLYLV